MRRHRRRSVARSRDCPARVTNRRHAAVASRLRSAGHLSLPRSSEARQRFTLACAVIRCLRLCSGKPSRHAVIAARFSCNATAWLRSECGIVPKPVIHDPSVECLAMELTSCLVCAGGAQCFRFADAQGGADATPCLKTFRLDVLHFFTWPRCMTRTRRKSEAADAMRARRIRCTNVRS